nr:MAG TPA: hypothetical protein [Caudoviricetes sp.]DAS78033.1 MAG TPA: hypothetical protein [Caudoviricetes sp.]
MLKNMAIDEKNTDLVPPLELCFGLWRKYEQGC